MSGRAAWTGVITAKAARPAKARKEAAAVRMVAGLAKGLLLGRQGHLEDCTHAHGVSVGRREEKSGVVCVSAWLMCMRGMCTPGQVYPQPDPRESVAMEQKTGGKTQREVDDRIVWKRWAMPG